MLRTSIRCVWPTIGSETDEPCRPFAPGSLGSGESPPSRIVLEREMVCSLICRQMSKRDDGYGSVQFGAATALEHFREAPDRRREFAASEQCRRGYAPT